MPSLYWDYIKILDDMFVNKKDKKFQEIENK